MRVPLLGRAAVFAALLSVSSCLTGSHLCPRALDCARAGRHFCQPGSSHCGPCLRLLVENSHGRCVVRKRHTPHSGHSTKGKTSASPELDEQIDFLSAIISEQRQTETRLPAPPSQDVTNHISKGALIPTRSPDTAEQPTNRSASFVTTAPPTTTNHTPTVLSSPIILPYPSNDNIFIITSSIFIVAASLALIVAATCWIRLQKSVCMTQKLGYPVYGLMREQTFDCLPGDKKLAHSAQMYHYQHQKQQMLCLEKQRNVSKVPESGATTDEENEDGDFTVYECPGLAPTGEMEVKNPLFDDSTLYLQRFHK